MKQHTIKKDVAIFGIGLHSGKKVSLKFKPAKENSGIVFVRTDLPGKPRIRAEIKNVTSTVRGTNLGSVHTVEHVLSALYAFSITNAEIELNSSEPPVLDGSSLGFCRLIREAGIITQRSRVEVIRVKAPVFIAEKDKSIMAIPSDRLAISFMINYPLDFIGSQFYRLDLSPQSYLREIAPARTYGFLSELSHLKEQGLAKGAGLSNAVAIGEDRYLTKLRFKDEMVRHKILDLIGDISLLGAEIKAHIICIRSGHDLNIKFARSLKEVG